jgi:hypothetical protein
MIEYTSVAEECDGLSPCLPNQSNLTALTFPAEWKGTRRRLAWISARRRGLVLGLRHLCW